MNLDDVKGAIRGVAVINMKNRLTVRQLLNEFREMTGQPLPLLGFRSEQDLLESLTDTIVLHGQWPNQIVQLVSSEKSAHIEKLKLHEKSSKKKGNHYGHPSMRPLPPRPAPKPLLPIPLVKSHSFENDNTIRDQTSSGCNPQHAILNHNSTACHPMMGGNKPQDADSIQCNWGTSSVTQGFSRNSNNINAPRSASYTVPSLMSIGETKPLVSRTREDSIFWPNYSTNYESSINRLATDLAKMSINPESAANRLMSDTNCGNTSYGYETDLGKISMNRERIANSSAPDLTKMLTKHKKFVDGSESISTNKAINYGSDTFSYRSDLPINQLSSKNSDVFVSRTPIHCENVVDSSVSDFVQKFTSQEHISRSSVSHFLKMPISYEKVGSVSVLEDYSCENTKKLLTENTDTSISLSDYDCYVDYTSPVPTKVQKKLAILAEEHICGIWLSKLPKLYETKFGSNLCLRSFSVPDMFQLVANLPKIFRIVRPDIGDWKVFYVGHPISDEEKSLRNEQSCNPKIPKDIQSNIRRLLSTDLKNGPRGLYLNELENEYHNAYGSRIRYWEYGCNDIKSFIEHLNGTVLEIVTFEGEIFLAPFKPKLVPATEQPIHALTRFDKLLREYWREDVLGPDKDLPPLVLSGIVEEGATVDVVVGEVRSPSSFFLQLRSHYSELNELMEYMNTFYEEFSTKYKFPYCGAIEGVFCAAKYKTLGWHRARIKEKRSPTTVILYYIDYGCTWCVNISNLRFLHHEFTALPILAFPAEMAGVLPVKESWETGVSLQFLKMVTVRDVKAHIHKFDSDKQLATVTLEVNKRGKREDVGTKLSQLGMAKLAGEGIKEVDDPSIRSRTPIDDVQLEENPFFQINEEMAYLKDETCSSLLDNSPSPLEKCSPSLESRPPSVEENRPPSLEGNRPPSLDEDCLPSTEEACSPFHTDVSPPPQETPSLNSENCAQPLETSPCPQIEDIPKSPTIPPVDLNLNSSRPFHSHYTCPESGIFNSPSTSPSIVYLNNSYSNSSTALSSKPPNIHPPEYSSFTSTVSPPPPYVPLGWERNDFAHRPPPGFPNVVPPALSVYYENMMMQGRLNYGCNTVCGMHAPSLSPTPMALAAPSPMLCPETYATQYCPAHNHTYQFSHNPYANFTNSAPCVPQVGYIFRPPQQTVGVSSTSVEKNTSVLQIEIGGDRFHIVHVAKDLYMVLDEIRCCKKLFSKSPTLESISASCHTIQPKRELSPELYDTLDRLPLSGVLREVSGKLNQLSLIDVKEVPLLLYSEPVSDKEFGKELLKRLKDLQTNKN